MLNEESHYKAWCEKNNNLSSTWESDWNTFVLSVKQATTYENSSDIIQSFVETLKRIRHNALCARRVGNTVDREDREQWPSTTVVRAFHENKLDKFKEFTERSTNENPSDPKWIKRWTLFVESLEENRTKDDQLKTLCSKFMTAQRAKKYRHSKNNGT
jgi:hypothetical protein